MKCFASLVFGLGPSPQTDSPVLEAISRQIGLVNDNLSELTKAVLASNSFWNSQLFAAMVGASSAIVVVLIQQLLSWRKGRKERLQKIYLRIASSAGFFKPAELYRLASRTGYDYNTTDQMTGKVTRVPDKPLGEKMVIELRSHVKYWN